MKLSHVVGRHMCYLSISSVTTNNVQHKHQNEMLLEICYMILHLSQYLSYVLKIQSVLHEFCTLTDLKKIYVRVAKIALFALFCFMSAERAHFSSHSSSRFSLNIHQTKRPSIPSGGPLMRSHQRSSLKLALLAHTLFTDDFSWISH